MRGLHHFSAVVFRTASLTSIVIMAMGTTASALRMTEMPEELQTAASEPQMRRISLKLPLRQPVFHWSFMSKEDLLAGKLVIRIIRGDTAAEIVIFEDGKMTEGWESMNLPEGPKRGEIYFGFMSSKKYATAPTDIIEIELDVKKDLDGIGALHTATLPKGVYTARGTYSGLFDEYKVVDAFKELPEETLDKLKETYEFKAFLENWEVQWALNISGDEGWIPPEQRHSAQAVMERIEHEDSADENR